MSDIAEEMLDHAFRVGAVDPVVTSYRANPELLALLLATPGDHGAHDFSIWAAPVIRTWPSR